MEKDNSINDLSIPYVNEIFIQEYMFDRNIKVAKTIKEISLNDIIELYHSIIKQKVIIKII